MLSSSFRNSASGDVAGPLLGFFLAFALALGLNGGASELRGVFGAGVDAEASGRTESKTLVELTGLRRFDGRGSPYLGHKEEFS